MAIQKDSKTGSDRFLQLGIYAAMLTPLIVVSKYSIFPFIFPKVIYFEIVVGLLVAALLPRIISEQTLRIKNAYTVVAGIYAVVLIITATFAFDSTRAFWSNFERMTGVVFLLFALAFSYVVAAYLKNSSDRVLNFLKFLIATSVVVSILGIVQRIPAFSGFLLNQSTRVAGTFGNPIYLGGFSAQFALLSSYFVYKNRKTFEKWWYVGAATINLLAVYLSGTRSALLGLFVAVVLFAIFISARFWKEKMHRSAIIGSWVGSLVIAVALFLAPRIAPNIIDPNTQWARFTNVEAALSGTGSTRLIAWDIAIKGFLERPLLGWGPENYYFVFNKFYNPKSLTFGQYETWFDHAHNAVFDVLVTQGSVGFIVYLLQYGVIIWLCLKTKTNSDEERFLSITFVALFALHFVHNFFVFDHPSSYAQFYALAGIVAARYEFGRRTDNEELSGKNIVVSKNQSRAISGAVVLLVLYVVVPGVRQNYFDFLAQSAASIDLTLSRNYFERAIEIDGPFTADVLIDSGRTAQKIPLVVNNTTPFLGVPEYKKFFEFAVNNLERLLREEQPGSELGALMLGQLYMNAAQFGDQNAIARADAAFAKATELSPDRQQVAYSWARLKLLQGDSVAARKLLEDSINKEPSIGQGHWYLAVLLADIDANAAYDRLQIAAATGYPTTSTAGRLVSGLISSRAGKTAEAADLFSRALYDAATNNWDVVMVKEAELVFQKTGKTDALNLLRTKFAQVLNAKK